MDAKTAKKALEGLRSRYGLRRAAPLMGEEQRRRLGITIAIEPEQPDVDVDEDDDEDDDEEM